ncbi:LysR family transcriptional regulator [Vibrio scophthalmi]
MRVKSVHPYPNLPYSHNALKVFESVARLMSFTKAAQELHVTQSAVSRQIKQLEDDLNSSLIVRQHRAISLTPRGKELFEVLRKNYQSLSNLIASWQAPTRKRIVIKSALSYATRVLLPKVEMLNQRYPDHEVVIIPSIEEDPDLSHEDCDLLIINTQRREQYQGQKGVTFLRDEYMAPVYAQSMSERRITQQDVLSLPHLHATLEHQDWNIWLNNAGLDGEKQGRDTVFFSLDLALSACLSGQGVTVTDLLLVLPELQRGFLQCPEGLALQHSHWCYFCYRNQDDPLSQEILEWLVAQTEQERALLRRLAHEHGWGLESVTL